MNHVAKYALLLFLNFYALIGYAQEDEKPRDKRTPFDKVIYQEGRPFVSHKGEWVQLKSIEGIPIDKLLQMSAEVESNNWKKGFHRYLHYIFDEMGIVRKNRIRATFLKEGRTASAEFELKKNNRDLATAFHDSITKTSTINRVHLETISKKNVYLTQRLDPVKSNDKNWLTAEEAEQDLDYLEWELVEHYSYLRRTGFDYESALDAIRSNLNNGITKRDFAYQLKLFMANFGDGHSGVSFGEVFKESENKWLPFRIIKHQNEYYAVNGAERSFYNPQFPKVTKINDMDINLLFNLSKKMAAKSTPKFIESGAVSYLNKTGFALKTAGFKDIDNVSVTFESTAKTTHTQRFELGKEARQKTHTVYRLKDSILQNNIGFLALKQGMKDEKGFLDSLHISMGNLKNTRALIIDIRGNGGGSRAPLNTLLPYFISEPKVVNIARYRIDELEDFEPTRGYLRKRFMYPGEISPQDFYMELANKDIDIYNSTVAHFQKSFKPAIKVEDSEFSDYHYMVVAPTKEYGVFYYDKPVIVLIDEGCFSASDIFAAGFKQGDHVRLLGNPTGGGSGYTTSKSLPNSDTHVRMSRIISYQPNGKLYDGHGVVPDIQIDYSLSDRLGKTDTQLQKAIQILDKR